MERFSAIQGEHTWFLYFLKCLDGYYYVGVSSNIYARLAWHNRGDGCVITKAHPPIELIGVWELGTMTYSDAECIEDEFVVFFMSQYGKKVRGGHWSSHKVNVRKVLSCHNPYSPCEQFEMLPIKFHFAHKRRKRRKQANRRKAKYPKFKTRDEKVKWICLGSRG